MYIYVYIYIYRYMLTKKNDGCRLHVRSTYEGLNSISSVNRVGPRIDHWIRGRFDNFFSSLFWTGFFLSGNLYNFCESLKSMDFEDWDCHATGHSSTWGAIDWHEVLLCEILLILTKTSSQAFGGHPWQPFTLTGHLMTDTAKPKCQSLGR